MLLVSTRLAAPSPAPAPEPIVASVEPSLVCRMELGVVACPEPTPVAKPLPAKKPTLARLQEAPRPTPTTTRTLFTAAKPAHLSSTAIPSGAARLVTLTRVSGSLRVAIDPVAGGLVKSVRAQQSPPRLIIDVTGIPPIAEHVLTLSDPEVLRVKATAVGKATRLTVDLARTPSRVVQQGDSALVSY